MAKRTKVSPLTCIYSESPLQNLDGTPVKTAEQLASLLASGEVLDVLYRNKGGYVYADELDDNPLDDWTSPEWAVAYKLASFNASALQKLGIALLPQSTGEVAQETKATESRGKASNGPVNPGSKPTAQVATIEDRLGGMSIGELRTFAKEGDYESRGTSTAKLCSDLVQEVKARQALNGQSMAGAVQEFAVEYVQSLNGSDAKTGEFRHRCNERFGPKSLEHSRAALKTALNQRRNQTGSWSLHKTIEETPEASVDLNEVVAQLGQLGAGLAQLGQIVQSMQK